MNDHLHPLMAEILRRFAEEARKPTPEAIDEAMRQDKARNGYARRQQSQAMHLQLNDKTGFSF